MLDFTPIVRQFMQARVKEQVRYIDYADSVQQEQLVKLVERAALTFIGRKYDFSSLRTYRDFASRVPLFTYEDIRPWVMRMMNGEAGVLWPGKTRNFAQSSGTSGGKSKYIPITRESFKWNHYRGAADVVAHYLNMNPESRMFAGRGFILGGSFANEVHGLKRGVKVGDLSANLIDDMGAVGNFFRVPAKDIALMADWSKKLPALVDASVKSDVTSLSGVPSWFLQVLKTALKRTGKECVHDIWPNLEVFFHGGIDFEPYRAQYERICDMSKMHFVNTYNASEGFFATQSDWSTTAMLLLLDVGVFYEFVPLADVDSPTPEVYPAWEVEAGKSYELVITACNGLWRYRIGDTVTIEQLHPIKIKIAGRTRSFINAFGEELMVHNAEAAMAVAQEKTGAQVLNYTAAPVYATATATGRHQWLVEFGKQPASLDAFARALDEALQAVNSDYEAKRKGGIFMASPLITVARKGLFDDWLASTGKLGGQRKVPRLRNDREVIDAMLRMNDGNSVSTQ